MRAPEPGIDWKRLHPLTPVLRSAQLFYALALGAVAGSMGLASTLIVMLGAGILIAAWIFVSYLRFRYHVTEDSLIIHHGVLVQKRRVIPRSRIQNVDLHAGLLQRVLGVSTASIETAGGQGTEARLHVVSRAEGERLRDGLVALPVSAETSGTEPMAQRTLDQDAVRYLTPMDLAIAGATANRASLLVGALLGGDYFFGFMPTDWLLGRVLPPEFVDPESAVSGLVDAAQHDFALFVGALSLLAAVFVLAGWGLSVAASVVRYFDFTLRASNGELRVSYGMFTRRDKGFRRSRVQNVVIEEPILRRWLGLATMKVQTAGYGPSVKAEDRMETLTPLARRPEIQSYLRFVYPGIEWDGIEWRPSHPRSRRRFFLRRAAIILLLTLALTPFTLHALLLLLTLPFAWAMATLHYRHLGHARSGHHVVVREGFWNRRTHVIPLRKIQALHLKQSPFQRRLALGTLHVDTAGSSYGLRGPRTIDLAEQYGRAFMNGLATEVASTGLTF